MQPPKIRAGDSVTWHVSVPDYPAEAGWVLHYALRGPKSIDIEALAGAAGSYTVEETAATTRTWPDGHYRWIAYVKNDQDHRHTLDSGSLDVQPDLLTMEAQDLRSHARRMLELIEAALQKRIPKDQQSYEIDGQRLDRIPIERLEELRRQYQREVRTEGTKRRGPFAGTVKWRYS
tara:strand:+ start:16192 stop:16719 length:528 start_codon:yes stop_codon:yes gene_type:complete